MSKAVEICNSFHLLPLVHGNRALVPAHVPETEESLGNHSVCSAACEGASEPQFCFIFLVHVSWFSWQAKLRGMCAACT